MAMLEHSATGILRRDLLYTRWYAWFLVASALDIVMTAMVLSLGGIELNPVADVVIGRFGMQGAMAYKFALVIFVILLCEVIGRQNPRWGRSVAQFAVLGPAVAAVLGYSLILRMTSVEYLID
jgi:hypothetical protein